MLELIVALVTTMGLSPIVRALMLRHNVVDVPNHRSSHVLPVPRGGGLACLGGLLAACCVAGTRGTAVPWWAVAVCTLLAMLGFADDRLTLPAAPRLVTQVVAGAVMGFSLDGWLGLVLGVVVTAGLVNVVNFMDGINGITSLTMAVWGIVAFVAGRHSAVPDLCVLGAAAAGSALGFLPWNAPRARLFLGDVGSYLFGGLAAAGVITAWAHGLQLSLVVTAPLAIYAADVAWTLCRRARRGAKLTEAHREHTYQRLSVLDGMTHARVACVVAGFAGVAVALMRLSSPWVSGLLLTTWLTLYLMLPSLMRRRESRTWGPASS